MGVGLQINKFNDLNVFITGASSGIGLAVAKSFLRMGSNVYAVDNNMIKDEEFLSHTKGNFYLSDICDYEKMYKIINDIFKKVVNIDVLIVLNQLKIVLMNFGKKLLK
jgi:NADP-dependent 3-hydroxy acid dehydrogenase YdfG